MNTIKEIKFYEKKVFLKEPIKVSFGTIEYIVNIFLEMKLDDESTIYAEISNIDQITNVKNNQVLDDLKYATDYLVGKDLFDFEKYIEFLDTEISMPALCGIDNLLYGAYAKSTNTTISHYINIHETSEVGNFYTIGIKETKHELLNSVYSYLSQGIKNIKLKLGANVDSDIENINYLTSIIPDLDFRVDFNQGYTVNDFDKFVKNVDCSNITLFEQILKKDNLEGCLEIKKKYPDLYIQLDETIATHQDAVILAQDKYCDCFNIKLVKCGGIYNALKIAKIAEFANIDCMIGCMAETEVALSYSAQLAFGCDNINNVDLDSKFILKDSGAPFDTKVKYTFNKIELEK